MAVELQLGLALIPTKGFDLNTNTHLQPHDTLPCLDFESLTRKKRPHDLHFHPSSTCPPTLPLLLWNDHPNDDGDDDPHHPHSPSNHSDEEEEQENGLVGWPPLKKRRKTLFMQKRVRRPVVILGPAFLENGGGFYRGLNSNSRYVKVKMEGVGIARKVDLSQHHSFDALRATLMNMFDETDSDGYRLAYQNFDGDWLLAQDVTWRNFIGTVQRIKLEKNCG